MAETVYRRVPGVESSAAVGQAFLPVTAVGGTGIPACPRSVSANPALRKTPRFLSAPILPPPQTAAPPPRPATKSRGPARLPPPAPQEPAGSGETIPARADPTPLSTA